MANKLEKFDWVVVGISDPIVKRCQDVANFSKTTLKPFANMDDLATEYENIVGVKFVVVIGIDANGKQISNLVQVTTQCFPEAYQLIVVEKKMSAEDMISIKKSGGNCVIQEHEFVETCKLEFIANQAIKGTYIPVKAAELKADTIVGFTMYHLMPLNEKYLQVVAAGDRLSESKRKRMQEVPEYYCHRDDVGLYAQYLEENADKTAHGLSSRCRAQFLSLSTGFADLVLLITDQSASSSYDAGKKLYEQCRKTANELLANLGTVDSTWDVVTVSAVDDFGTIERSPAIAAYAGLLSLTKEIGKGEDVVLSAMLCDIGFLELKPTIAHKLRDGIELNAEEKEYYGRISLVSLNRCLSRKIPIPEKMKPIIVAAYERADGKGIQQLEGRNVPIEAQLIHFCRLVDQASNIKWGESRKPSTEEIKNSIIKKENLSGKFSPLLIQKVTHAKI